jgi:hypothetical protein
MDSLQRARMPQGSCQTHPTSENMFLKSLKATPMRAIEAFSNYGSDHLLSAEPNAQFKPPAVDLIQGRLQLLPFRAEMPPEREYDWPLCAKLLSRVTTSTSKARPQRLDLARYLRSLKQTIFTYCIMESGMLPYYYTSLKTSTI